VVGRSPSQRAHDAILDGVKDDRRPVSELAEDKKGSRTTTGCPDWDNEATALADGTIGFRRRRKEEDGDSRDAGRCSRSGQKKRGVTDARCMPNEPQVKPGPVSDTTDCPEKVDGRQSSSPDGCSTCQDQHEDHRRFRKRNTQVVPIPTTTRRVVARRTDAWPERTGGIEDRSRRPGARR